MKKTWSDGTAATVMDPLSFIGRLCALIPPRMHIRMHMVRFTDVLAAHHKLRAQVVPACLPVPAAPAPEQLGLFEQDKAPPTGALSRPQHATRSKRTAETYEI